MEITYGHQVESVDDYYVRLAEQTNEAVTVMAQAKALELFPIRKCVGYARGPYAQVFPIVRHLPSWFPGAWFVRYCRGM